MSEGVDDNHIGLDAIDDEYGNRVNTSRRKPPRSGEPELGNCFNCSRADAVAVMNSKAAFVVRA